MLSLTYQWTDFRRKKKQFRKWKMGSLECDTFENLDFSEILNFLKKKKVFRNFRVFRKKKLFRKFCGLEVVCYRVCT